MREKMLTRTVTTNRAAVLALNTTDKTVVAVSVDIPGYIPEKKMLDYTRQQIETDTLKVCTIDGMETIEQLYELPESVFLKYATPVIKKDKGVEEG